MTWTWAEPFAGAGACALRAVGGPDLSPPVAWMGGKRRYARAILDAMGAPETPPSRVLLADAGPWGWVWPLLLEPGDAARVARVLRSWAGEHPRELWQRLAARPPYKRVHERAAQWLWLQARSASGVPIWWDGWRHVAPDGRAARDRGEDLRWPGHRAERARWVARGGWRFDARPGDAAPDRAAGPAGETNGRTGGMVNPSTIAERIEAIARAFRCVATVVHHGDVGEVVPVPGAFVLLDGPYENATGYGWGIGRAAYLELGGRWLDAGAEVVALCEAVPLDLPGWHHLDLTREGAKPEWLTLSRAPARVPERQTALAFPEPEEADRG